MFEDARAQLAARDVLRAGINLANPLLVSGRSQDGTPYGVAPALAAAIADRLGVPVQLVPYVSPAVMVQRSEQDEWDIALIGADPERERVMQFCEPYVEIEATYLAREHSAVRTVEQADAESVTIVATRGSAYELWLGAHLQHARLVSTDGDDAAVAEFTKLPHTVLAGLAPVLRERSETIPETRVVPGRFMSVQQAIGTQLRNDLGAAFLQQFIVEAKRSGLIADLLSRFDVDSQLKVAAGR